MRDVTWPLWLLVTTHLATAVISVFTWWRIVMLLGDRIETVSMREKVKHLSPKRTWLSLDSHGRLIVTVFVLAALLIGFGGQQYWAQHESAKHDECITRWGGRVIEAAQSRSDAARRLEGAQQRRDEALDNIILVVIGLRAKPKTATLKDFKESLVEFANAKAHLSSVQEDVTRKRENNPFPQAPALVCD